MSDELAPPGLSPLAEANPASLNELIAERITDIFNRPPLGVSDADLDLMVEYYQRERLRFKQESELKEQRPRQSRKTPTSVAEALESATADML